MSKNKAAASEATNQNGNGEGTQTATFNSAPLPVNALTVVQGIESQMLEVRNKLAELENKQKEALTNRKAELEKLQIEKNDKHKLELEALINNHNADMQALMEELTQINNMLGIVVAPAATSVTATAKPSTFKESDLPEGITAMAFAKYTMVAYDPDSMKDRILMILGNAGEGVEVSKQVLVSAAVVTGHRSKSTSLAPAVSTALNGLKNEKLVKSVGRGMYSISAKGLKEYNSKCKANGNSAKPAYIAGAAGSENLQSPSEGLKLKNVGEYILLFVARNKKADRAQIAEGILQLGYQSAIKDAAQLGASLQTGFKKNIDDGFILAESVEGDARKKMYSITPAGEAAAKQLEGSK